MLPLLRIVEDGREYDASRCAEAIAERFAVSADERQRLLPSGRQRMLDNRVGWARTYLVKAGLLERTGSHGTVRITERGRQALQSGVARIDIGYLSQYPEFEEFRRRPTAPSGNGAEPEVKGGLEAAPIDVAVHGKFPASDETMIASQTPVELLESSYQRLRQALAEELLDRISQSSPQFFEQLVVDLLVAMGYGGSRADAGQAVGRSGDDGVDGIIKEDRLGLDVVYVQAKRWDQPIGRPAVQAFAGSLEGHRARKGVFIKTSRFTSDAKDYVTRIEKRIVLIDGDQLAQYMIDHGVGVADVAAYQVKRVDADYFDEQ